MAAASEVGIPLETLPCVASRVEMDPHLTFESEAFMELATDRPVGFALGAIPWSSINAYAVRHHIAGDEFDRFTRLMREMDAGFLNYHSKQQDKS